MGTLTNGIKEIFATAKSTGTNVMLCGNDGTPDGHITMANLASVLGETNDMVFSKKIPFVSLDDNGIIHIECGDTTSVFIEVNVGANKNMANCEPVKVLLLKYSSNFKALFISGKGTAKWRTVSGKLHFVIVPEYTLDYSCGYVQSSIKINTAEVINASSYDYSNFTNCTNIGEVPTFYKNYSTLSALTTALGVDKCFDGLRSIGETHSILDVDLKIGCVWSNYWTDIPSGASSSGTAFSFNVGSAGDVIIRFYIPYNKQDTIYMNQYVNRDWQGWHKIALTSA